MPELILHHYPQSPVSEKVRIVLGLKGLAWRSVEIPRLPPKPDLVALTGGYRLTPVLQIGADIFCDSQRIIREIDARHPEPSLYPGGSQGLPWGLGRWTDGPLFQNVMALVFVEMAEALPPAFVEDRSPIYFGDGFDLAALNENRPNELAQIRAQLAWIDERVRDRDYVLGATPGLPDAFCYYLIWFLRVRYSGGAALLGRFPALLRWEEQVRAIGHGRPTEMTAAEALEVARRATPRSPSEIDADDPLGLVRGDAVGVTPAQGGATVIGALRSLTLQDVTLTRHDERVGEVAVHFPRVGYRVTRR